MMFEYTPVTLAVEAGDGSGLLVFRNGALLAVVSQLSARHEVQAGWWFVEFVFHPGVETPWCPFESVAALDAWLHAQIG